MTVLKNPKISVVMSVYNQAQYLNIAIKSILDQTYKTFELLILDDGSTDKSWSIIKSFTDKRIRIFRNEKRQGLAKGLNFLINKARGVYIARMDADDISFPNRLKEQVAFLNKNSQVVLVGCRAIIINQQGQEVGKLQYPINYQDIKRSILSYNPFIHPSVCFRKEIIQEIGGYDEQLFYSQDYDLFLRLIAKYPCVNIPEFLFKFRWQPDFAKQKKQHLTALKIRLKAIKDYGYRKWEIVKLIQPLLAYLTPTSIKQIYWWLKLS